MSRPRRRNDAIAQMAVFLAPCGMVDIAVRLAHAGQRETGHARECAGGVDQTGDLPEPAFVDAV